MWMDHHKATAAMMGLVECCDWGVVKPSTNNPEIVLLQNKFLQRMS